MIIVYVLLAAMLVFVSYKSFRGGIDYLRYFRTKLSEPVSEYTPFASIIAPCKGLDDGLAANLSALLVQDYPEYEVIFVVDDPQDAAMPVIEQVSRSAAINSKVVTAGKSVVSSQKVENLREAVLHISPRSEVLVFVDSDARPSGNWLRDLVSPLADETTGAATGYRWFISKRPGFASELRSAWNASIASALGPNLRSNFCWGGSTAIRRGVFERLKIRERWHGTLSDDFTITRVLREAEMPIYFVPQALTASVEDCTLLELLEFTTRQIKITRVYAPHLWRLSMFGSGLFTVVMVWSLLNLLAANSSSASFWASAVTFVAVSAFSIGKAYLRLLAVRLVLPQYKAELKRQSIPQNTLWLLATPLFFVNCLTAAASRKIRWRGTEYILRSADETEVLGVSGQLKSKKPRP